MKITGRRALKIGLEEANHIAKSLKFHSFLSCRRRRRGLIGVTGRSCLCAAARGRPIITVATSIDTRKNPGILRLSPPPAANFLPMASLNDTAKEHLMHADLSDRRVLLVDRHTGARDALRMMLANLGVTRIHGAASTTEVLRQVKANSFDIIFSDYLLEDGRDGQQLLEELRMQRLIPLSTIFIVVTSERGYHNVVSLAELTPDDYLIKPFTSEQLHARLAKALFRKSALNRVLRHVDGHAYGKALGECEYVLLNHPELFVETLRLKGELLNLLGKHEDAEALFREVLATRPLPWAKMGLAVTLRARRNLAEAEILAREVVKDHPHFLAAHDFLGKLLEESGKTGEAQAALLAAAEISPNNTARQRFVGDIAVRNGDLDTAEKAYQTALLRSHGSSIAKVDDYSNLSRVYLDKGNVAMARSVANELRRDRRWDAASETTALIVDSLCHQKDGDTVKAKEALDKALIANDAIAAGGDSLPEYIAVDLARACLAAGEIEKAHQIVRQVASENPDDPGLRAQMENAFEKTGRGDAGKALLDEVAEEIAGINSQGVQIALDGDLEGSVDLLSLAADRMPNIQFLVNASTAIFTLMDKKGWKAETAEKGARYLIRAQQKDPKNPKVVAAGELLHHVAAKYGISVASFRQQALDALRSSPASRRR